MKFDFDEKQLKEIASSIKVNYLPNTKFIDANTYGQIIDKTFDLAKEKYVELVRNSRKEQRKNMANHKVYFELISSYMTNLESLVIQAQRKIYSTLGFDVTKWEEN